MMMATISGRAAASGTRQAAEDDPVPAFRCSSFRTRHGQAHAPSAAEDDACRCVVLKATVMSDVIRPVLTAPNGAKKVLLHSCCAPCSGEVMEAMLASGIDYTIFFYNPNIHPKREYNLRKEENIRFAEKHQVPFIDADYDPDNWFARAKGMEWEPERGARCTMCFDMRFERTALFAHENDFPVMTSSLGISRWKNLAQINACGIRAASAYEGLTYWDFNWRKGGGAQRMIEISKREEFYQQEYCGCAYSLRDTNMHRRANGRAAIVLGTQFYGTTKA
jgi:epoxyqueuosine reductase